MVYNFTVDALHTYTVTELRVVVHNINCLNAKGPHKRHYLRDSGNLKNPKRSEKNTIIRRGYEKDVDNDLQLIKQGKGIFNSDNTISVTDQYGITRRYGFHQDGTNVTSIYPIYDSTSAYIGFIDLTAREYEALHALVSAKTSVELQAAESWINRFPWQKAPGGPSKQQVLQKLYELVAEAKR